MPVEMRPQVFHVVRAFGQGHQRAAVEFVPRRRRGKRRVRVDETRPQEKRLGHIPGLQKVDAAVRHPSGGMEACGQLGNLRDIIHFAARAHHVVDVPKALRVDELEIIVRIDRPAEFLLHVARVKPPQSPAITRKVHLAHAVTAIPRPCEAVHQRGPVRRLRKSVVKTAVVVRVLPGDDRCACRHANRRRRVSPCKIHALAAKPVHDRRANVWIVSRVDGVPTLLVRQHEQNIGLVRHGSLLKKLRF